MERNVKRDVIKTVALKVMEEISGANVSRILVGEMVAKNGGATSEEEKAKLSSNFVRSFEIEDLLTAHKISEEDSKLFIQALDTDPLLVVSALAVENGKTGDVQLDGVVEKLKTPIILDFEESDFSTEKTSKLNLFGFDIPGEVINNFEEVVVSKTCAASPAYRLLADLKLSNELLEMFDDGKARDTDSMAGGAMMSRLVQDFSSLTINPYKMACEIGEVSGKQNISGTNVYPKMLSPDVVFSTGLKNETGKDIVYVVEFARTRNSYERKSKVISLLNSKMENKEEGFELKMIYVEISKKASLFETFNRIKNSLRTNPELKMNDISYTQAIELESVVKNFMMPLIRK